MLYQFFATRAFGDDPVLLPLPVSRWMWLMLFQITEICLKYICHDPNYNYDDDEEAMDTEADDEEEE